MIRPFFIRTGRDRNDLLLTKTRAVRSVIAINHVTAHKHAEMVQGTAPGPGVNRESYINRER